MSDGRLNPPWMSALEGGKVKFEWDQRQDPLVLVTNGFLN